MQTNDKREPHNMQSSLSAGFTECLELQTLSPNSVPTNLEALTF